MQSTCSWGRRRSPAPVGVRAESSLESWTEPGSRRNPGKFLLQLKSGVKSGSRRSQDGAYQQLMLATEPGSRRSPGGVLLAIEVVDGARLP